MGCSSCDFWNISVAVKILHTFDQTNDDNHEHFLQEIRILRLLNHPCILSIIDAGFHEGAPYIVTEYAPNGSLRDKLDQLAPQGLELIEALAIISQIGQALDYAHKQSVIHRDIKPENILFTAKNEALLADFDLAVFSSQLTPERREIAGTLQYMAPEQFIGLAGEKSDQYALGCLAYEFITGHPPFPGGSYLSMWFTHSQKVPPSLTQFVPFLPLFIERTILQALAKKPEERFDNITAFLTALYDNKTQTHKETPSFPSKSRFSEPRRLPLYLLLDCSNSMAGDPIVAINEGVQLLYRELVSDPQALETVYISIITFSTQADQYGLTTLDVFHPPFLQWVDREGYWAMRSDFWEIR